MVKKILHYFVLLFVSYLLLEFLGLSGSLLIKRKIFFHPSRADGSGLKEEPSTVWTPEPQNVHPYVGYVETYDGKRKDVSQFGFIDSKLPIQKRSADRLIVGIFGGSMAHDFSEMAAETLKTQLKLSPEFSQKEIIVFNFGAGGYKQPQQLMILTYLLALGAQFDAVINLDGFNEVALPVAENIPNGVFPFFPRSWNVRVHRNILDTGETRLLAEISGHLEKRKYLADIFSSRPWRYSISLNILWECADRYLEGKLSASRLNLLNYKSGADYSYTANGPPYHYNNRLEMYRDLARVWKNSSVQMERLCLANNIRYFHFLQPNQYVAHSKIFKPQEARIAIGNSPYRTPAMEGYPYLKETGAELNREGVHFWDLTMIFENREEPLYRDNCCHLNQKGMDLLAVAIAQIVAEKETK